MKKIILLFSTLMMIALGSMAQDTTYKELVGKYKFPAGTVIEEAIVTLDNGVINMSSSQGVSVLEKMKGDTFNIVSFNGIAVFKRNDAKKITGVHVDASGYIMDGEKDNMPAKYQLTDDTMASEKWNENMMSQIKENIAVRSMAPKIIGCIIP